MRRVILINTGAVIISTPYADLLLGSGDIYDISKRRCSHNKLCECEKQHNPFNHSIS